MKLVTLTKLTLHTPEGDRSKFFADDLDALFYKKTLQTQQPITLQEYTALQSDDDYCIAIKMTNARSNATFKAKNAIYTATVKDGLVELGSSITMLSAGTNVYLSEDNHLYLLGDKRIAVEAARDELQHAKADFNEAITHTKNSVTTVQTPRPQPTLHQFWGAPSTEPAQPPTTPVSDPMELESAEDSAEESPYIGYDYFGVNK